MRSQQVFHEKTAVKFVSTKIFATKICLKSTQSKKSIKKVNFRKTVENIKHELVLGQSVL